MKYESTESNTNSRTNRLVKNFFGLTVATAFGANNFDLHTLVKSLVVATGATAADVIGTHIWTKNFASRYTNDINNHDLPLYIVPWKDGYVVGRPTHKLEHEKRKDWWNSTTINSINPKKVQLAGYFKTVELAEIDSVQKGIGLHYEFLDANYSSSEYKKTIFDNIIHEAEKTYSADTPLLHITRSQWCIFNLSSQKSDDHKRLVAHRTIQTTVGIEDDFFPPPPDTMSDSLNLKKQLEQEDMLSGFDKLVPSPRHNPDNSSVLPSWREQAIAAKGLDYYAREIEVEDCDLAMPSADSWAVERSPNSTQWRAVQTETRCEHTVRRLLVRPEDPMTIWEEPSPKAFAEFFAHQGITIEPPSQQPILDAPRVNRPQASLSQPRMRK